MRIGWNQIRDNALKFSIAFKNIKSERAESQTFYNKFFDKKMNNKEEVLEYLMSLHRNQFSKNLS